MLFETARYDTAIRDETAVSGVNLELQDLFTVSSHETESLPLIKGYLTDGVGLMGPAPFPVGLLKATKVETDFLGVRLLVTPFSNGLRD